MDPLSLCRGISWGCQRQWIRGYIGGGGYNKGCNSRGVSRLFFSSSVPSLTVGDVPVCWHLGGWCTRSPVWASQLSEGCQELGLMQHTVLGTNSGKCGWSCPLFPFCWLSQPAWKGLLGLVQSLYANVSACTLTINCSPLAHFSRTSTTRIVLRSRLNFSGPT